MSHEQKRYLKYMRLRADLEKVIDGQRQYREEAYVFTQVPLLLEEHCSDLVFKVGRTFKYLTDWLAEADQLPPPDSCRHCLGDHSSNECVINLKRIIDKAQGSLENYFDRHDLLAFDPDCKEDCCSASKFLAASVYDAENCNVNEAVIEAYKGKDKPKPTVKCHDGVRRSCICYQPPAVTTGLLCPEHPDTS